jgi:hypothetical protein
MKGTSFLTAIILVFSISITQTYAENLVFPLLNKDEFSCYFNLCSFPDFIITNANINNANDSLYLNGYPSSYFLNQTFNTSAYITNETEPSFNGNWSNISSWLYNQTTQSILWVQAQNYLTGYSENDPYYFSNPNNYFNSTTLPFYNNLSVSDINTSSYYQLKVNHSNVLNMPSYLLTEQDLNYFNNPSNYYNITTLNNTGFWNITSNNTNYINGLSISTFYNSTNPSNYISNSFLSNVNTTIYNLTSKSSSAGLPICWVKYNSTGTIRFCSCYNDTMAWDILAVSGSCAI